MSFLAEILSNFILQALGSLVFEMIFELGDLATHGRMQQVSLFMLAGGAMGFVSHFFWPRLRFRGSVTRYVALAGIAIATGLVVAIVDSRRRRGGRGAATAGFFPESRSVSRTRRCAT